MRGLYPLSLLGGLSLAGGLMALGVAPGLAAALPTGMLVVALWVLERRQPIRPLEKLPLLTDTLHMLLSSSGTSLALGLAISAAGAASLWIGGTLWPTQWPLALQLMLALVLGDLGAWWGHRLCHLHPLLWRIHALHHSSPDLYVLAAGRTHPLNAAWVWLVQTAPLILLGASPELLALHGASTGMIGLFQHSNLRLHEPAWCRWILATPSLHRTHHDRTGGCCNYGNNLIIWDVLFGTRLIEPEPDRFGVSDLAVPASYTGQLMLPFQWAAAVAPAAASDAAPEQR